MPNLRGGKRLKLIAGSTLVVVLIALLLAELFVRAVAAFVPEVRYAAMRDFGESKRHENLEAFLESRRPHIQPYRRWQNYWNNSLGFRDTEFEIPKPVGRFRILALGDSFAHGQVLYPDNVLTSTEKQLSESCRGLDVEILNFGIPATGLKEYKSLLEFVYEPYEADRVLMHFYMGNDGPHLLHENKAVPWYRRLWQGSALANYLTYLATVHSALERPPHSGQGEALIDLDAGTQSDRQGGMIIDPKQKITDESRVLRGPTFKPEEWVRIAAGELGRLYDPGSAKLAAAWEPYLRLIEAMRGKLAQNGIDIIMVLFPSQWQVYDLRRKALIETLSRRKGRYAKAELETRVDPDLPNRVLMGYCEDVGMRCLDVTPAMRQVAVSSSKPLYIERNTHWNIHGNLVAAAAEASFLVRELCPGELENTEPKKY